MGQAMRMMAYDRAANERNALPALNMAGHSLNWFRLDDGVMGGQSETVLSSAATTTSTAPWLEFKGTINTNGGGFASIRARLEEDDDNDDEEGRSIFTASTEAIQLCFRGDGKTYKVLLSDGKPSTGGPFAKSPSWQADLPTKKLLLLDDDKNNNSNEWQQATIPLSSFRPSFGPRSVSEQERDKYKLDATNIKELGLMLSLKLSNGQPNPVETFGQGIFDFCLVVKSIEPVCTTTTTTTSSSM